MAQPMSAASTDTPAEKPAAPDQIIYPKNSSERPAALPADKPASDTGRMLIVFIALALAGAGAWILIQRRQAGPMGGRGQRKLQIDETRPLGNRQYLVVADYDGKKFLLGVAPGQIRLLTPLETEKAP